MNDVFDLMVVSDPGLFGSWENPRKKWAENFETCDFPCLGFKSRLLQLIQVVVLGLVERRFFLFNQMVCKQSTMFVLVAMETKGYVVCMFHNWIYELLINFGSCIPLLYKEEHLKFGMTENWRGMIRTSENIHLSGSIFKI